MNAECNNDKCGFHESSLTFLGYIISADGLLSDATHVELLMLLHQLMPLHSFLGLLFWNSKFLSNYTTVVEPM